MRELITCFNMARRELRGGLRGFRIFLACLVLGVATIAGMGAVTSALNAGMAEEGQSILGGDMELALVQRRATEAEVEHLRATAEVSEVATLRAMARRPDGTNSALIEVKAIDGAYPLFGEISLVDDARLDNALANKEGVWGLAADQALLDRLGLELGDRLRIGQLEAEVRAMVALEPDRLGGGLVFGPRVFMTEAALSETELIRPGSLVRWRYRLKLPDADANPDGIKQYAEELQKAFPDAGWRQRSRANAAPGAKRFIERLNFFMTLAGLTALIIGGVGIANAIKNHLDGKRRTIATFKCLGASGGTIFRIYLFQILILTGLALAIALTVGALLPAAVAAVLGDALPIPIRPGLHPTPLAIAALFGVLVTLVFTIWPLGRARDVPGAVLFRAIVAPQNRWPPVHYIAAIAIVIAATAGLALAWYENKLITAYYLGGTAVSFAVLYALGRGLIAIMRRAPRVGSPEVRLAVNNIHRPGSPAPSVILSLGLGLALIVTLALIDNNLSRELRANIPEQAPTFFFVDIQPDQIDAFSEEIEKISPGAELKQVPMLRGRIVKVGTKAASEISPSPNTAWALRGDRGLTYSTALPEGSRLVKGEWWSPDHNGKPLVSLEAEIAYGLGLDVGDDITVNVLGRKITATVANLRAVDWDTLGINFVLVYSPNALKAAPHTFLATLTMDDGGENDVLRSLSASFPNVTAVRMKEAIDMINAFLQKLLAGIRGASGLTLLMSVLVLAGALASGYQARMYDAAILKAVGGTRRRLIASYCIEYLIYAVATSAFALLVGTVAAYAVIRFVMDFSWSFDATVALTTALIASIVTLSLGIITSWRTLGVKPARLLRSA